MMTYTPTSSPNEITSAQGWTVMIQDTMRTCSTLEDCARFASEAISNIQKSGVEPNAYHYTALMTGYMERGALNSAEQLFKQMSEANVKPTSVTYVVLISAYARFQKPHRIRPLVMRIIEQRVQPCAALCKELIFSDIPDRLALLEQLIDLIPELTSCKKHDALCEVVLKSAKESGWDVQALFDRLTRGGAYVPSVIAWSILVDYYADAGKLPCALAALARMVEAGVKPNKYSHTSLLKGHMAAGDTDAANTLLLKMRAEGVEVCPVSYGIMVKGYVALGRFEEAWTVLLRDMADVDASEKSPAYDYILDGYIQAKSSDDIRQLLKLMQASGVSLTDGMLRKLIISHYVPTNQLHAARRCLAQLWTEFHTRCSVAYNATIKGYTHRGDLQEACKLLREMKSKKVPRTVVTYTTLISGYAKKGSLPHINRLMEQMKADGIEPNEVTYSACIRGLCASKQVGGAFAVFASTPHVIQAIKGQRNSGRNKSSRGTQSVESDSDKPPTCKKQRRECIQREVCTLLHSNLETRGLHHEAETVRGYMRAMGYRLIK